MWASRHKSTTSFLSRVNDRNLRPALRFKILFIITLFFSLMLQSVKRVVLMSKVQSEIQKPNKLNKAITSIIFLKTPRNLQSSLTHHILESNVESQGQLKAVPGLKAMSIQPRPKSIATITNNMWVRQEVTNSSSAIQIFWMEVSMNSTTYQTGKTWTLHQEGQSLLRKTPRTGIDSPNLSIIVRLPKNHNKHMSLNKKIIFPKSRE